MQDVLNQSLNTGMVFVEQHMGNAIFKEYMLDRFKLGQKTGVDLPGEINGIIGGLKDSNNVNFANAAFGQGVAFTPLSIVKGFAMLANGGYIITPHIATKIKQENGATRDLVYPKSEVPVLKSETVATMASMLTHVVDDGYHRGLTRYTVAAKTGTAQVAKPNGGGYYTDRNLHSLVGYFPATNPRYVVYFYNLYPKGAPFAILSLGDSFFEMIQFLGGYYDIPPDR
jgi:cell division protein FtsI/penicillin-binding protein 2